MSTGTGSVEIEGPKPLELEHPVDVGSVPSGNGRRTGLFTVAQWLLITAVVLVGLILRAWFLYHRATTSDEAIVGIMGQQILHGHNSVFYWGQYYGGVEQYLIALRYAIFGFSSWALPLIEVLLAMGTGVLTWRIAHRMLSDPFLAALTGAAAWAVPEFAMNTLAGFRGVTTCCGLALILISLRIIDRQYRAFEFAVLGFVAGVGFWSSPEIAYYVAPPVILLAWAFWADRRDGKASEWIRHLVMGTLAAVVGALPWLWSNVRSHFASLSSSTYQVPPGSPHFLGRLKIFFHYSVGLLLNVRQVGTGFWLFPRPISIALELILLAVIGVSLVLCLAGGVRSLSIGVGLVAFPLILAFSPGSWYWKDGRFVTFVVPYFMLVIAVGGSEAARRIRQHAVKKQLYLSQRGLTRMIVGTTLSVLVALTAVNFAKFQIPNQSVLAGWGNPNQPTLNVLPKLEAAGVSDGFADYWVAYRLDFLSGGKLHLTVVGTDPDRWSSLNQQVVKSKSPAWIFVTPDAVSYGQFGGTVEIEGPAGQTEAVFIADLKRDHIGYRVVTTGLINAVIPDQKFLPQRIGARPA